MASQQANFLSIYIMLAIATITQQWYRRDQSDGSMIKVYCNPAENEEYRATPPVVIHAGFLIRHRYTSLQCS
jgi:hypothetical protein